MNTIDKFGKPKIIGGIAASTVERLAEGLVTASQTESGHVNPSELRAICRLVLKQLRAVSPECPCPCGSEPWHIAGVCEQGAAGTPTEEKEPRDV